MPTDSERDRALKRARNRLLRERTRIQADTAGEIVRLLRRARREIRSILAGAPTDFQAFQLPQIERAIASALAEFAAGGTRAVADGATRSFQAGAAFVDEPIAAGGVRIAAVLPEIDPRQLQAMRSFLTGRIRDIGSTMAARINTELGLVTIGVKTPSQAVSGVQDVLGASRSRAITIVRTELGRAFSVATDERLRAAKERLPGLKKQWRRSGKLHERPHHAAIDGQVRDVDEPFRLANGIPIMFPRDPRAPAAETVNCFAAATIVSGRIIGAMRMPYCGDVLTLRTRNGLRLTVTPNHPVLTTSGFRPAASLHEGDHLISHGGRHELRRGAPTVESYEQQRPAAIEEIFRALRIAGGFRRPRTDEDFHGDGVRAQGDIEVVGPVGELLARFEAARFQCLLQRILEFPAMRHALLARSRSAATPIEWIPGAAARLPGVFQLAFYGVSTQSLYRFPLEELRLGDAANLNVRREKSFAQNVTADSRFIADLLQRGAGTVLLDEIAQIDDWHCSGEVYDVQSPLGWIVADGLITSNCGCESLPFMEEWGFEGFVPLEEPSTRRAA